MKKSVFIPIAIFLLALVASLTSFKSKTSPEPVAALQGSAAVQQLKADGSYASLAAAFQAARYAVTDSSKSGLPLERSIDHSPIVVSALIDTMTTATKP